MKDNMSTKPAPTAADYLARWSRMKTVRMNFMVQWDDVARYCIPRKGNILTMRTAGQAQTTRLFDTTADDAGGIFAAGCVTHICPAGEKWIRLEPKGHDVSSTLQSWYDAVTDKITDSIYESNFYEAIHEDFNDAGHFGTSCLFEDEDPEQLFNFVNVPVGSFAIEENARGQVDTVCREWKWSARQAEQKWGKEALGKQQREALESADPNAASREFTYLHFVEPRVGSDYKGGAVSDELRPIRSCYICTEDQQIIEESGYYTMPYFVSRLLRSNNEVYGRGPGIQKLPDVRLVNSMMRDYVTAIEKLVNPPWLQGDDQSTQLDSRPNGVNFWDTTNPAGKPEQIQLKNNVQWAKEMIDEQREIIRDGYYNKLFQMLTNMEEAKREKTAYEVQQMVAEQLLLFSPLFGRMTREKLNPLIQRTFDILARASAADWATGNDGVLPLPPDEIRDNPGYNIVYVSKIALAIKAAENQSFSTMLTLVEQAAALDPTIVDLIDWKAGVRRIARNIAFPSKLIRSDSEANSISQQKAQAQAQAQQAQNAELATRAVKNLGPQAQSQAARKIIGGQGQA